MSVAEIQFHPEVDYQAKAVLAILENAVGNTIVRELATGDFVLSDLENLRIETFVMHNGRERGYCLVATYGYTGPALLVNFAEHRNSDAVFVWTQEVEHGPFNAPSHENFSEESYRCSDRKATNHRVSFGDSFNEAAEHICHQISASHARQEAKRAEHKKTG